MPAVVRVSSPSHVTARVVTATPVFRPYAYGYGYGYPNNYGYPYNYGHTYPYYYSNPYYNVPPYPLYNNAYYAAPVYTTPAVVTPTVVVSSPASSTTYGTCKAISGVGVTSNNCAENKMPVSTIANGCMCADQTTGIGGCGNVTNGVCK